MEIQPFYMCTMLCLLGGDALHFRNINNFMKTISTVRAAIFTTLSLLPLISNAQGAQQVVTGVSTVGSILNLVTNTIVSSLATLMLALAMVAFFFGIVQFIWGLREGEEKKITNGKQFMLWSVIALFVMFSIYGVIRLAQSISGVGSSTIISIPTVRFGGTTGGTTGGTNTTSGSLYTSPGTDGTAAGSNQTSGTAGTAAGSNQTSGGGNTVCTSAGGSCSFGGASGVCAQSDTGDFYCQQ